MEATGGREQSYAVQMRRLGRSISGDSHHSPGMPPGGSEVETISLGGATNAERQTALAREFITNDRYERMRAAAKEGFGLTDRQSGALFLHWKRSGALGGQQDVVLIVGMAYRGHPGNTPEIVRFCREFVEGELAAGKGGGPVNGPHAAGTLRPPN